jgi:hypothetical protein
MQYILRRHTTLNVIGTIDYFILETRFHVLGQNYVVFHLFQCPILSLNNNILLRGLGNRVLMSNSMFSTKISLKA